MTYTSLYRKYRPETFRDVIGQDHIVRTLINQLTMNAVGHAYLFTGTRGTGKTSVAKIFARAVNCLDPQNGSPCGKCDVCLELALSGNFDVLEIDAASNNSVDQIRELTDKINFPPTIGRYKVYIIDEVHMLSKSAHNALLKTLEEPPSHAIFILATTEVHAIPATILSRCLRFDFRLVPTAKIAERIRFIFDDNKIKYEKQALELIASAGTGSVRDALSIADMCVSYCAGDITYDGVLEVLGASDPKKLIGLAEDIAGGNIDGALKSVATMCDAGKSMSILAQDLASLFRNVLYIKTCGAAKSILSVPDETYAVLKVMSEKYPVQKCLAIMRAMSNLEGEFRYSTQHRILFESALILAASDEGQSDNAKVKELENKITLLERKIQAIGKSGFNPTPAKTDARQVLKAVASELGDRGYVMLTTALLDTDISADDDVFKLVITSGASYAVITEKNNRDVLNEVFTNHSSLRLVIEEAKKLDEDTVLPYIKTMFGKYVELKP